MTSGGQSDPKAIVSPRSRPAGKSTDPIQRAIGDKLRKVFDEVLQEPAPERFALLLKRLEDQERGPR